MEEEDTAQRRVRFSSAHDLSIGFYVPRVAELVQQFDPKNTAASMEDILELHNVQKFLEHGFLPSTHSDGQRGQALARIPQIQSAVARFFSAIDESNFMASIVGVSPGSHRDLVDLLGRNGVYERCASAVVLPALEGCGVHLSVMLTSKKLVNAYDTELRLGLRNSPMGAELLIRRHLQADSRDDIHLPPSLTPIDARQILEEYIDWQEANPNYIDLIAAAKDTAQLGIDAKLRLQARRRSDDLTTQFFKANAGFKTGCEVSISDTQVDPHLFETDESEGFIHRNTYSRSWLEATRDNASILNNFVHLFGFVDHQGLLVFPSYPAQLSVLESIMGVIGKTAYKVGIAFHSIDASSLLQTRLYQFFLESNDIDLEQVIAWFFETYLADEFNALNFSYSPSDRAAPYLQRVRHLFAEMESVASQFSLFVHDGEIDRDLLTMGSDQVRYKEIPSLLDGKYVYATDHEEITGVLHLLFSDQSRLTYIRDDLRGDDLVQLLIQNRVTYKDFEEYQRPAVDHLIKLGILSDSGSRVQIANSEQLRILHALFNTEAASYFFLSDAGRREAEAMVAKGWVTRESSLLTEAEGSYFNYFLNAVDHSNGPQLRNKYTHGAQKNVDGEAAHFQTYITALRLLVALVIKINDDFCLSPRPHGHEVGE